MNIFQKYSKYYDLFYRDKDYKKESGYIYNIISRFYKNPLHILNLGCGTGNHDFYLLDRGLHLTSVDSSREAINIANSKKKKKRISNEQIKFFNLDIRKINLKTKFDCAIALFHVINYLNSNTDLSDCFKSVNKHLKKNGLFVFDSWYGPAVLQDLPEKRTKMIKLKEHKIVRKSLPTLYPNENIAEIKFKFNLSDNKNKSENSFTEIHRMRYLFYPEIEMLLKMSGFALIHAEEWMTGQPIGFNSWYALFVARKI